MSRETGTGKYENLLKRCKALEPITTAVAWPCEETALAGAIEAGEAGLITPILVGPGAEIAKIAKKAGLSLDGIDIVEAPDSHAAATRAVALVREGRAELLMKGSLHSDELLSAVIAKESGLRAGRRSVPALVDLTRDGLADLLIGRETGGLAAYRNAGSRSSPRFTEMSDFSLPLPPMAAPAIADLDGDGKLDIVSGTVSGGLVFLRGR